MWSKGSESGYKEEFDKEEAKATAAAKKEDVCLEELERKKRKVYIPSNSTVLKTVAQLGLTVDSTNKSDRQILPIVRQDEVEESRYNLPVSTMEFKIIYTIKSNDVTILCSETGSIKSTQIYQFLYKWGITLGNS